MAIHKKKGIIPPEQPDEGIIIAVTGEGITSKVVGSLYLYESGPFLHGHYGILNDEVPLRLRHQVSVLVLETFMARAAIKGLIAFTWTASPGIRALLRRYGFAEGKGSIHQTFLPAVPLTMEKPGQVSQVQKPKPKRRKRKPLTSE